MLALAQDRTTYKVPNDLIGSNKTQVIPGSKKEKALESEEQQLAGWCAQRRDLCEKTSDVQSSLAEVLHLERIITHHSSLIVP
ncbi:MAG: hypothetical protein E6H10_16545 [Bacteroidetes bacterium]|nr:MAG: hypothetical protein E6H10_16545 [Bacteroidota bacterium]